MQGWTVNCCFFPALTKTYENKRKIAMEELIEILMDIDPDIEYETHKTLMDDGILTSFELVSLVSQIADTFGVRIPPEQIIPENFNSAARIYKLIERPHWEK